MSTTPVAMVRCPDYSPGAVEEAVSRVLLHLGGLDSYVSAGSSVLLKPNMLTDREPDRGVTTHPEVVRVLVRKLKDLGAHPFIADSPANVTKTDRVWEKTGFASLAKEEGVPLVSLEDAGSVRFSSNGIDFTIARPVIEADAIITIPKVKTHVLTILTGAVKNLYGTVPGFQKTDLHMRYPTVPDFTRVLVELYRHVTPCLAIADGITAMEGDGPSGGTATNLGVIAGSSDSVALDRMLCDLLGINARSVSYLGKLGEAGLGEASKDNIEILGDEMADLRPSQFKVPSTLRGRLIPGWIFKLAKPLMWIRPSFSEKCVQCGRCVKACPMQALSIEKGNKTPQLDTTLCIECCCCHEVCPQEAVEMKRSPLMRWV